MKAALNIEEIPAARQWLADALNSVVVIHERPLNRGFQLYCMRRM